MDRRIATYEGTIEAAGPVGRNFMLQIEISPVQAPVRVGLPLHEQAGWTTGKKVRVTVEEIPEE